MENLKKPFRVNDIEWRIQSSGIKNERPWARVLAYVTNRAIQERLDDTVGCNKWQNQYVKAPEGGVLCGISIKLDGEWITKWDGAENTNIEAVKGGLSGAMKRAAVQWGIGRYLYELSAGFANISEKGKYADKIKTPKGDRWIKWDAPNLPAWAVLETNDTQENKLDFDVVIATVKAKGMTIEVARIYYEELKEKYNMTEKQTSALKHRLDAHFNVKK